MIRSLLGSEMFIRVRLSKGDYIVSLFGLNIKDTIMVTTTEQRIDLNVADIPVGSSVYSGTKMIKTKSEEILYCYFQKAQD